MDTALLSGIFALVGVLIAQTIALTLAWRADRRRSDPELLRQCAWFSSSAGRFKRDVTTKSREDWDLTALTDLEAAGDSIAIIGTPEIERAAERLIGSIAVVMAARTDGDELKLASKEIFDSHREFTDAVRQYFHKPPKTFRAVPMLRQ